MINYSGSFIIINFINEDITTPPPEGMDEGATFNINAPLIVNVDAAHQEAEVKLDIEEWDRKTTEPKRSETKNTPMKY